MRSVGLAFLLVVVSLCSLSLSNATEPRWESDGALVAKIVTASRSRGIVAVQPHVKAIESALKAARSLFSKPISEDGKIIILTDGRAETAAALVTLRGQSGEVVAVANPYPTMGILLGSYYVETGKFRDAVRVLDAALALSPLPKDRLGQTVPDLLSERGVALGKLKRWDEALASYDAALRIKGTDKKLRAILYRGRGFVLIEMGRLDEAEAAYKKSLTLEPGNKIALGELQYIKGLRAGQKPTEPQLTMPNAPNG